MAPLHLTADRGAFQIGIWDAETGKSLGAFSPGQTGHTGVIACLEFDPKGSTLATGSWDHSIGLWEVESRKHLASLRGQSNEIWSLTFSPDGDSVICGGKDGSLHVWPARKPVAEDEIPGLWRPLAISVDGGRVAAIDRNERVAFFDLTTKQQIRTIDLGLESDGSVEKNQRRRPRFGRRAALSGDLKTLVEPLDQGFVRIWDTETRETRRLRVCDVRVGLIELSPSGRHLVAGAHKSLIGVWDLESSLESGPQLQIEGERVVFSTDGSTMLVIKERGKVIEVWDFPDMIKKATFEPEPRAGMHVVVSPDGKTIATAGDMDDFNNFIHLWNEDGTYIGQCSGHKQGIWSLAFSPDGKSLVSSSSDSTLKFWNVATQQEMLSLRQIGTTHSNLLFSSDGRWLVGSANFFSQSGSLRMIKAPDFDEIDHWISSRLSHTSTKTAPNRPTP